jgi:hypothetical protein
VQYYQGQPVPLTFVLTDKNGNPVQAAATPPIVTTTLPDGTTQTPPVTYSGTPASGYTATGPSTQPGHYLATWVCTDSTYPGALTDSYNIRGLSEVSILSFADAKRILRIDPADTSEDDFIAEFNPAVTSIVEWYCGPVLRQAVTERLPAGGLAIQLSLPPVISLTAWTTVPPGLATAGIAIPDPPSPMFPTRVFGVSYPLSQLYADPKLGIVTHTSGLPFYYGEYLWSYLAGRPVIPDCLLYASRAMLKHLYGIERGGAGGTASLGNADEETTMTPLGFAIPNRMLEMMTPEKLPAAIA